MNLDLIRDIVIWIVITAVAIFMGLVFTRFFGFRFPVSGNAMSPQIVSEQQVLINKLAYRMASPAAGDVIAYYPGGNEDAYPAVSRVIAISGQMVQIVDGRLLVDGIPYSNDPIYSDISYAGIAEQVISLGEDEYFILGDNPSESEDSRSAGIGAVRESDIIGKVWFALPCSGGTPGTVQ